MSNFSEKYKEYESRKKKTNRNGIILLITGLIMFSGLFLYSLQTQKEKKLVEKASAYKDLEIVFIEKQDSILNAKKKKQDNSVKEAIQQVKAEINEIKFSRQVNKTVRKKIDSIEVKLKTIESIADRIIVRYYKRKADEEHVEQAIKSISKPNFCLHYSDVPNDNGTIKVNALYYGKNVNENHIKLLKKSLTKNKVDIKYIKPFVSAKGFEWKQDAIEIGYEKQTSTTNENAKLHVRIYGFKSNKKIKYAIRNKLEAKGFQVKLYPDWSKKPSFFSNESTVLYYNKPNKDKAMSIAKTLTDLTRKGSNLIDGVTEFKVKIGVGYGVSEDEKKELFIVHYNGSKYQQLKYDLDYDKSTLPVEKDN